MSDHFRPHGRVVAVRDETGKFRVLYEPASKTCFIINTDYYGWVKSLALGVAADFLEEYVSIHSRFSVHGSCIDFSGRGVAIIAPSGTGKTTHSFGILFLDNAKLVSDDWFFVKLTRDDAVAYASERNSYIRDDIGEIWETFRPMVNETKLDSRRRGVANVEDALGGFKRRSQTIVKKIIILKRDAIDRNVVAKMSVDGAMKYLIDASYCNPHQLVNDSRKQKLRETFFRSWLSMCDIYIVNTAGPVDFVHAEVRKIVDGV
jgi:hypothetical protein